MAKLNGVVMLAETIEYNGERYTKTDENAVKGDIIRFDDENDYVTTGAFYEVTEVDFADDPQIIDNDGDEFDLCGDEYVVFKRVESSEGIVHNGITYRKVSRKPNVGDVVVVTSQNGHKFYDIGSVFTIKNEQGSYIYGRKLGVGGTYVVHEQDITVLEPIQTQPSDDIVVVDGVKYRKVDRKPIVGDFVYATEYSHYMTEGKVYEIFRTDNDGDGFFRNDNDGTNVYPYVKAGRILVEKVVEKVTEPSAPTTPTPQVFEDLTFIDGIGYVKEAREAKVGEMIIVVEATMAFGKYTNGDTGVVKDDSNSSGVFVDINGGSRGIYHREYNVLVPKYREVKRKANVGEKIRIVNAWETYGKYANDDIFTVDRKDSGLVYVDSVKYSPGNSNGYISSREYVVLEPYVDSAEQTEPKRLQVGDYAKVISVCYGDTHVVVGDIVEVTKVNSILNYKTTEGKESGMFPKRFVHATDEEIAEFKRKVAERDHLKVGEFGKIVDNDSLDKFSNGDIVEIKSVDYPNVAPYFCNRLGDGYTSWMYAKQVVRATDAEVAEAKAALDPRNQFAKGDSVKLISGGSGFCLNGYYDGQVYTVNNPKGGADTIEITGGEQRTGYAKPEQLVKLTAEEAETLRKQAEETEKWAKIGRKVNEYKAGDLVRVIGRGAAGLKIGHIDTVVSVDSDGDVYFSNSFYLHENIELVAPVESLFTQVSA